MKGEAKSFVTAQSEVIGVVLILALVMTSIGAILVTGMPSIDRIQQNAETERVANEFSDLDAEISTVTFGGAKARNIRLNTGGGRIDIDNTSGWVNITHYPIGASSRPIYNRSLGKVEYEANGEVIAYQGGGVWRTRDELGAGSGMLSPPEFRFRGSTLTFPIVSISSTLQHTGQARSGGLTVSPEGTSNIYPNETDSYRNPIDNGTINVTVKSRYYDAWANYFEERTDGKVVKVDDTTETATVELSVEASTTFEDAILASNANTLNFQNQVDVASYNSSNGIVPDPNEDACSNTYPCSSGTNIGDGDALENGEIRAAGEVILGNKARLFGDLTSAQYIRTKNNHNGRLQGDAVASSDIYDNGGTISGTETPFSGVSIEAPFSPDSIIQNKISDAESTNSNAGTGCIDSNDDFDFSLCELEPGSDATYYLNGSQTIDGDTLDLDTDDGDISLAIDGDLILESGAILDKVDEDNNVTYYVNGDFKVKQSSQIEMSGDSDKPASKNLFLISSGGDVVFRNGNSNDKIIATVYAPESGIEMSQSRTIYGALIVEEFINGGNNQVDFYYDQSLKGEEVILLDPTVAITYLHVTENRVEIE